MEKELTKEEWAQDSLEEAKELENKKRYEFIAEFMTYDTFKVYKDIPENFEPKIEKIYKCKWNTIKTEYIKAVFGCYEGEENVLLAIYPDNLNIY